MKKPRNQNHRAQGHKNHHPYRLQKSEGSIMPCTKDRYASSTRQEEREQCYSCGGKGTYSQMHGVHGSEDFGGEGFDEKPKIHNYPCRPCNGTGLRQEGKKCCEECFVFIAPHLAKIHEFSCNKKCKCHATSPEETQEIVTMEKIIKKAIEGGWRKDISSISTGKILEYPRRKYKTWYFQGVKGSMNFRSEEIVCDPLFWQALSKACEWAKDSAPYLCKGCGVIGVGESNHMNACKIKKRHYSWKQYALRFHEINLTENWDVAVTYLTEIIK